MSQLVVRISDVLFQEITDRCHCRYLPFKTAADHRETSSVVDVVRLISDSDADEIFVLKNWAGFFPLGHLVYQYSK